MRALWVTSPWLGWYCFTVRRSAGGGRVKALFSGLGPVRWVRLAEKAWLAGSVKVRWVDEAG